MWIFRSFIAGFISTLVFHQGLFHLLYLAGKIPRPAWDMTATPPLQVPAVISLAFWGGVWGVAIWAMIKKQGNARQWLLAIVLGALLPSIVALLFVFPLKGMAFAANWDPKMWIGAFLLNGAWGLGVILFMKAFGRK
ncbi:MAG TPA: hypothetical protein PLF92_10110 [Arenimonas sp.]|nr:hypothetical protein [Arenimonas sp.]HOZ05167.1 hypothetical protein [Arenimonas sp.]HPO23122.1 hypothetical protein [Arenimonas sp.]HPW33249.1 hypothetical protein [Arenimonas sp.]